MTLEILICTIDGKISGVGKMLLPPCEDVRYLVSWQQSDVKPNDAVPEELHRSDVRVVTLHGKGLSRNRNNALKYASGDICLIADDDLQFYLDGLREIIRKFSQNSMLDIATFCYSSKCFPKKYPGYEFDLCKFPKGYYVSSIEIAFRRTSVQCRLWFDEHFGIGAPVLAAGEESVFMHDALCAGLNGRFFPIVIAKHDHPTTGERIATQKEVIMSNAAYLYVALRHDWLLPRAILMAWRVHKKGVPLRKALEWVADGIIYARKIRKVTKQRIYGENNELG